MKYIIAFVTASSEKEAEKIADGLIDAKACACVNIIPKVKSIFIWEGKKDKAQESLLIIKTTQAGFKRLKALVRKLHSYTTPEIIGIDISQGDKQYLDWISSVVRGV
ncbi:MAG: divalent-cation tolerance protein CutA [Candidatus Omnitrophica bacterium]|nr:divalent-cation tolerance protein CutA [Candidatus Omnitrophota bacterium]